MLALPHERATNAGVAEDDEHGERGLDDRENAEVHRTKQARQRDRADEQDDLVYDGARRQRRDRVFDCPPETLEIDIRVHVKLLISHEDTKTRNP